MADLPAAECPHCDSATPGEAIQGRLGSYLCPCCGKTFTWPPGLRIPGVSPS
jgi:transposase-like protein